MAALTQAVIRRLVLSAAALQVARRLVWAVTRQGSRVARRGAVLLATMAVVLVLVNPLQETLAAGQACATPPTGSPTPCSFR